MEHRLSRRQPLQVPAIVRMANGLTIEAVTMNLSPYGAMVSAIGALPDNTFVHLDLGAHDGPSLPPIPGVVVHSSARGAGIMFVSVCDIAALHGTDDAA